MTVVLVVIGTGLLIGIHVYRQQQAIREIEALGGRVETVNGRSDWLREPVGDDWMKAFDDVNTIELENTQVTDAGLEHLKSLTNLKVLFLGGIQVTDAELVHLKSLTNLDELSLGCTHVTRTGLVLHLKNVSNLKWLYLDDQFTHSDIEELERALPGLSVTR